MDGSGGWVWRVWLVERVDTGMSDGVGLAIGEGMRGMTFEPDPAHEPSLSRDDAAAMEALFAAGLDPARVHPEARERANRVMALLSGMEAGPAEREQDRRLLVDVAFARAVRSVRTRGPGSLANLTLAPFDADAADALEIAGYKREGVPSTLSARAGKLDELGSLIRGGASLAGAAGAGASGTASRNLIDAVMARVAEETQARGSRMRIEPSRGLGVAPILARWRDLVSVAAVLMVGTSVLWTMAGAASHYASRASCASGLRAVASAMGGYAGDYRDELPIATASLGGGRWWDVRRDTPVSNSANLYTLPRTGYASLAELSCSGNPSACKSKTCEPGAMDWGCFDEISYSYHIMFGQFKPKWNEAARRVVLADRSPVVKRAVAGERIRPDENSMNHMGAGTGAGQNILFSDGSVEWRSSPVLESGDNIWLPKPRVIEVQFVKTPTGIDIRGQELPRDPDDAFVGP